MATSNSVDFNMTARDVITFALRKINLLDENEEVGAGMADRAKTAMNAMLKGWQKHPNLWRMTEGSVTLIAGTYSYALSPHPHRVITARYRDANTRDLPMEEMSRDDYYDRPLKSATGIPTEYYVDYQRAAATIYFLNVPASITTETVKYTFLRKFEDIDDLSNDIDIRQEHFEMTGYKLASILADDYGRTGGAIDRIIARAEAMFNSALDDDRGGFIQFVPGYR